MTTIRPAAPADQDAQFRVFLLSLNDLLVKNGLKPLADMDDPESVAAEWANNQTMLEHIAVTADLSVVAEDNGEVIGYARSFVRDNVRQLTEFFVRPDAQSAGVGQQLLRQAFPAAGVINRVVIATGDGRALARYLKAGLYPLFSACSFQQSRPQVMTFDTVLDIEPLSPDAHTLAALAELDREVLGYARPEDHVWLMQDRPGFAFRRRGELMAYAYVGARS